MTFKATATYATFTKDSYENGQTGKSEYKDFALSHEAGTIQEVLELIRKQHELVISDLSLDSCDEIGRIDVSFMEDEDGMQPSDKQLEEWKQGKLVLWCVDLTYTLTECNVVSAKLPLLDALKNLLACPALNLEKQGEVSQGAIDNAENAVNLAG